MPLVVKIANLDDLIQRYVAGESIQSLAKIAGVSTPTMTRRIQDAGHRIRTRGEGIRLWWKAASPRDRERHAALCAAGQAAMDPARRQEIREAVGRKRRGTSNPKTVEHGRREAVSKQNNLSFVRGYEMDVAAALFSRGFAVTPQRALGVYNIDLALEKESVAVEIQRKSWNTAGPEFRKRTEQILNAGWCLCFVIGYAGKNTVDPAFVADNVSALAEACRRDETLRGQYWVVGCNADVRPRRTKHLDGLPRIASF